MLNHENSLKSQSLQAFIKRGMGEVFFSLL